MLCQNVPGKDPRFCWERGCTTDINSQANYCLEQQARAKIMDYRFFYYGPHGQAFDPAFPTFVRQGRMPANNFSFNAVDIESSLFNIGVCNLVEPKPAIVPQFKENLQNINFFERPELVKQEPFIPTLDQRPWPICQNYS
jgi:hypothetical protein